MDVEAVGEVEATAAPGIDATQTASQTTEEHVDIIQAPSRCRPSDAHLWLLVDEIRGDDEDVVGAHIGLCGAGTGVDARGLAPVDVGGAVAVRRRWRGVAAPEGTAVAACIAEAGEVVLHNEAGDEAGEAVQIEAVGAGDVVEVGTAATLWGEEVIVSVRGRHQAVRNHIKPRGNHKRLNQESTYNLPFRFPYPTPNAG